MPIGLRRSGGLWRVRYRTPLFGLVVADDDGNIDRAVDTRLTVAQAARAQSVRVVAINPGTSCDSSSASRARSRTLAAQ